MSRIDTMIARTAFAAVLLVGGANLATAASTSGASNSSGSSQGARGGEPGGRSGLDYAALTTRNPVDYCRQRGGREGCGKGQSDPKAMVCYYTQPNFKGSQSCIKPGIGSPKLTGRWNDNISSIRVVGNASTKLCSDKVFGGYCVTISSSRTQLGILDDEISSFRVN